MIAVIGATGFTGRRVVLQLRQQFAEEDLVAVVRPTSRREWLQDHEVSIRTADLDDIGALREAFAGARFIVSTVSMGFGHAPNLVAALQAVRPDHAIFFSTMSIYSQVVSRSRGTRIEAEQLITGSGLPYTIFRPTMIYGRPGDRNIERLLRFLRRSPLMPIIGNGAGLQQPAHVDDLAAAVGSALARSVTIGHSYNLPGPRAMRFTELVHQAAQVLGRKPMFIHVPAALARSAVRVWSLTGLWPAVRPEQVARLTENKHADPSRANREFGFAPREFQLGVREEAALLGLLRTDTTASSLDNARLTPNARD
jgi:uncharacterized protein YbjT (DUF2867 family)